MARIWEIKIVKNRNAFRSLMLIAFKKSIRYYLGRVSNLNFLVTSIISQIYSNIEQYVLLLGTSLL